MSNEIEKHERYYHQHDEEVLETLFGPRISKARGGGRDYKQGLVDQMRNVKEGKTGVRIALRDKAIIAVLVLVVEAIRIIFT